MKVLVFSGTSEGKKITEYLSKKGAFVTVCVATQYGKEVMPNLQNVSIHTGRLDENQMIDFISGFDFVVDATHPFAEIVTNNIFNACNLKNIRYIRLLRDESIDVDENITYVQNVQEAIDFLENTVGNIFVSTGSKELHKYSTITDYQNRIIARVLPVPEAHQKCDELQLKNVIYQKGPFSYDENYNQFKKYNAKWIVTKSSGKTGGFDEKISAAKKLGINVIVIKRPNQKNGLSFDEVTKIIDEELFRENNVNFLKFPLFIDLYSKKVVVVGGGKIAIRRINTLIKFGACVTVVAPEFNQEKVNGNVEYINRKFNINDLDGAFMVIGATNDRDINHLIYELCKDKNVLYSIADCKEECNFFFPAVCTNDELSIGIVSDGNNHKLVSKTAENIRRIINGD